MDSVGESYETWKQMSGQARFSVLSMSRQGDPTARCLTTERTLTKTSPRYNLVDGILLLTIYPEIKRDVVSCLDVNVSGK